MLNVLIFKRNVRFFRLIVCLFSEYKKDKIIASITATSGPQLFCDWEYY